MPSVSVRLVAGALIGASALLAMTPPDRGMIEQYKSDGTLQKRKAFAKAIGNDRMSPELLQRAQYKLKKAAMAKGLIPQAEMAPPPAWKDMPTTGNVKILTILIDFNDYPHNTSKNSQAQVATRIFGNGDAEVAQPYESFRNFYLRSSYGKLNLTGNVLGWYRPSYNRADMPQTTAAREALIKEALDYYNNAGHDFTQYDNNGDGKIDFFSVIWTGPDNGWSNFWWGYQTSFNDSVFNVDGLKLGKYSWQWESRYRKPDNSVAYDGPFTPSTLIHEQGHGLGLPDYYDYDNALGPRGGVGGLDIMDWAGDHNCFSKWLLDWISPEVVNTDLFPTATKQLRDQSSYPDALIVMPGVYGNNPFSEFFMVQNRQATGNDVNRAVAKDASGLLVWHVDARLDGNNFDYASNNSYTDHKLLRLMEADGLEEIETNPNGGDANAGDFYVSGKSISPSTTPNTARYDGTFTYFGINNVSASGPSMTLDVYTTPADTTIPTGTPTKPTATTSIDTATFDWTIGSATDSDGLIVGYYLQVGTTPGGSDVFDGRVGGVVTKTLTNLGRFEGTPLYARVRAMNAAGLYSDWSDASDSVTITLPVMSDCADLDNCNLTFKKIGTWEKTSDYYQKGTTSVQGSCADNERITLQTRVTGPGTLSYYWKASTEKDYDYYSLSIDGVLNQQISGEVDWTKVSVEIPAGSHLISWSWAKDGNTTGALDKVWLDAVTFGSGDDPTQFNEVEPNNSRARANVISSTGVVGGAVNHRYDIDMFKVTLKKGQTLRALLACTTNLRLECQDANGKKIATGSGRISKSLKYKAKKNQVVYVRAYYGKKREHGNYQLGLLF